MYHVVCGTYESPLYGWRAHLNAPADATNTPPNKPEKDEEVQGGVVMEQMFAYAPHTASIRVLAASGEWLVSSSTDEALKVYDLSTRRELGTITRNEGQITSLDFFKTTHLFCGTERGDVLVWKTNHWEQMPSMKGHTGRVNSVSVHPSGVLALTVSQDKTLRLWDLEKGAAVHTNKLEHEADIVKWSPDGKHYLVSSDKRIVLYSANGKKLRTFSEFKRVIALTWLNNSHFATGGEDRKLLIWDIHSDTPARSYTQFGNRIKGLDVMPNGQVFPLIVCISSDERIRVFDPNSDSDIPVCSIYQDVRLICLTVSPVLEEERKTKKSSQKREVTRSVFDDAALASAKPSSAKKFKVIEYEDNKPVRAPGAAAGPKGAAAPAKSILKKKTDPAPLPESASPKAAAKKEKLVLNTMEVDSDEDDEEEIAAPQKKKNSSIARARTPIHTKAARKQAYADLFAKKK